MERNLDGWWLGNLEPASLNSIFFPLKQMLIIQGACLHYISYYKHEEAWDTYGNQAQNQINAPKGKTLSYQMFLESFLRVGVLFKAAIAK